MIEPKQTTTGTSKGGFGARAGGAFTLVELLVVVSVIALLVAILIPSLHRAREHGYDAVCKSNLRQIWEALNAGPGLTTPGASAWVAQVQSAGAGGVLKCPKHSPEEGGGGPISVAPNVVFIEPPESAAFNDDPEDNTAIHAFLEQESYALPADVLVDITEPGYYESAYNSSSKIIPAGTVVDSHFLFFDPVGSTEATSDGAITMGADIIGVICLDEQLDATDAILGRPGTKYSTGQPSRGYESVQEKVSLEPDMRTFRIHDYYSTFPGENIRILTGPGGAASYGMNNQVQELPRVGQLMVVEYVKTIVDVDGRGYDDDSDIERWLERVLAARHLGKANGVFVDGSVTGFWPKDIRPDLNPDIWQP